MTTFGKDAQESGVRSSKVRVNGCVAKPDLLFHYGRATSGRIYDQKLTVDASCLRYGVRPNDDAEQPDAKENRIRIETAEMLPDALATECGDHGWSWVRSYLKGDARWWDEQIVPWFRMYRLDPVSEGGGEESARRWAQDSPMIVEFEALAHIALVHGYADAIKFYEQHGVRDGETEANEFADPMKQRYMAYELIHTPGSTNPDKDNSPNIMPQEAWLMGRDILDESKKLAQRFGSDHVSIVSHSLGAIWSRFALEQLLSQANEDVGVFSLITLAPAHNGSVLGDIRHTTTNTEPDGTKYKLLNYGLILRRFGNMVGPADNSLPDSTTWKAREFRVRHTQTLKPSITVKGLSNELKYYTVAVNFNRNRNCLLPLVNILDMATCKDADKGKYDKDNECSRYKDYKKVPRWLVLQIRSITIQGSRYVLLLDDSTERPPACSGPTPGQNEIVACLIDQEQERGFWDCRYPYNDFTLRTEGMYFDEIFSVFAEPARQPGGTGAELEPIGYDSAGRPFYYRNHGMVGDSTMAEKLFERILSADVQKSQKSK